MGERLEIIESIEILRKNSHKYKNKQDYTNKLYELYDRLSKTSIKEQEKEQENRNELIKKIKEKEDLDIFCFDIFDSEPEFDIKLLAKKYPVYNLISIKIALEIDLDIDLHNLNIHLEPVYKNYDKIEILLEIGMLLKLWDNSNGLYNKIIIFIIIYNILLENFSFVEANLPFKNAIKNKYSELIKSNSRVLEEIIIKYNLPKNLIEKWDSIFL